MSLIRKENNLRKAQTRLDKVSKRSKQFQIDFRREENSRGRFHTRAYIVCGEKEHHSGRGILHKAVGLKYRVKGDKPSVTRFINSTEPKTVKGKITKKTAQTVNFAVHDVAQTAVDVGLASEVIALKTGDIVVKETANKLKQKYTREAVDDYHKGVFLMGRTAVDAVKGTRNHFKQKKQFQLEKAKYRLKKADNKLFKVKTYKPKMAKTKGDLKAAKAEYKSKIVRDRGNKLRRAMNKRRLQAYKQSKRELKFERKQIKTEKKFRRKEQSVQRKIARKSKLGLLALQPAKYTAGRMKASAWQKAVNEDQDNDFVHAIDSTKRRIVEPEMETKTLSKNERTIAILTRSNYQINEILKEAKKREVVIESDNNSDLYRLAPSTDLCRLTSALCNPYNPTYLYDLIHSRNVNVIFDIRSIIGKTDEEKTAIFIDCLDKFYNSVIGKTWKQLIRDIQNEPVLKTLM